MEKIDSHHHFWRYRSDQYGWIADPNLRRDFMPADLETAMAGTEITGVVSVQARQNMDETWALLNWGEQHDFIRGVVGWVALLDPDLPRLLPAIAEHPKLRALRHVVQDEPDDDFILRDDFNAGIAVLKPYGLVYDILIFERHLPQTTKFVDRHPNQVFVLDHIAKPRIKDRVLSPWRQNIRELARRPHLYCKLSGMVTEADTAHWTPEHLRPYFDTVLDAFGPKRLMFGSDWPVCLSGVSYRGWYELVSEWTSRLSMDEQARFWAGTAREAYRL
jgi:L-fuconolactonase